ncbi:prolipoprotein diacylglyceryl transferase [Companilactobacillus baiquanensis]|uniref:Gram-positive cocci surface proteins LPxTG domain-containing protein n=1 Tax=Companilactobacillus baiquanensis TaxID=2486005 RepID=A0ABW1USB3_9LACO|nr:hypothetical protein [Companilactobacillus baiquanensis]
MLNNGKHPPHESRRSSKISNNLILASMATMGVVAGVTINQETTLAAADDTVGTTITQPDTSISGSENTVEQPVEDNTEEDVSATKLSDHYTNAQDQVDDANGKANDVNDSLAKLQELLSSSDLTSQTDWQATLQNALNEYRDNATAFNDTTAKTQELISMYQEKINQTIKDQPNAVDQVTDTKTTGTSLTDYQQLTNDFQKSVSDNLQTVQNNLDSYGASSQFNQVSANLTEAAKALNEGLADPNKTSDDIINLKENYDTAATAYNEAVTTYNNNSGSTMATINFDDNPDITQILSDLKTKEAYDAAVNKHQDVQESVETYEDAVKSWKSAVKAYNDALNSLSMSDITDDNALNEAQKAVEDAADKMTLMQNDYNSNVLNPEKQEIISNYLNAPTDYADEFQNYESAQSNYDGILKKLTGLQKQLSDAQSEGRPTTYFEGQVATQTEKLNTAEEELNTAKQAVDEIEGPLKLAYDEVMQANKEVLNSYDDALLDLQNKLTTWQNAYKAYSEAIANAPEQQLPDFEQLRESVDSSQTDVQSALDQINTSQSEYKKALDQYRTMLDNSGLTDLEESNGTLPDLTVLQEELTAEFSQNTAVMDDTPKLIAVINAEFQLQQRIVQINNIILAINSDQEMLKTIYDAAYQGDAWQALTSVFNNIGNDLATKAADYQEAVMSYKDLVDAFETAKDAYGADVSYTYPEVSDVSDQYETFSTDFTNFESSRKDLVKFLAKGLPDKKYNDAAVESMKDGTKLSTNGDTTSLENIEDGGTTLNIYKYFGGYLAFFIGKSITSGLRENTIGDVQNIIIEEQAKEPAKSSSGTDYYSLSADKKDELNETLRGMIVPSYEKDGVIYHLTGVMVPGTGLGKVNYVKNLSDIYVFTSLDPVEELMNMYTGVSVDVRANQELNFYYTASPQKGIEDKTELSDEKTLPALDTFTAETLDATGDLSSSSLAATGDTIATPDPNEFEVSTITGQYSGGETIDNAFDPLTIKLAPTITLNEVKETTNPENPDTTDPEEPDVTDPENPGTTDPEEPDTTDPENPDTTNPEEPDVTDPENPGTTGIDGFDYEGAVNVPSNNDDIVYIPKTGQIYDSTGTSRNSQNNLIKTSDNAKLAKEFPQTGQESKGIWSLLGSFLLAIFGFSFISSRKRD